MKNVLFNIVGYAVITGFGVGCIYGCGTIVGLILKALGVN